MAPLLLPPSGPAILVKLPPAPPAAGTTEAPAQDGAALGASAAAASAGGTTPDNGDPSPAKRGRDVSSSEGRPEDSRDGGFYLRMEPVAGCLSTCEAVARALCVLESATGSGGTQSGGEVCEAVLRPLARLVEQQASTREGETQGRRGTPLPAAALRAAYVHTKALSQQTAQSPVAEVCDA